MRSKYIAIIIVLLVGVGGYFLLKGGYQASAPTAPAPTTPTEKAAPALEEATLTSPAVREFIVSGSEFSFSPASISVKASEKVKITFKNNGRALHNLTVEGLNIGTKTIGGGKTDIVEFTAPASGTHAFFCSVPGHRQAGMEGQLKVE